ncbi:hypothetical protein CYMTET_4676 [Cymbomonas tetramitiformis]|uniref:ELMO domain-containing protein n=1 Tax=Cymbomonas tetramitiformis TaxID=36881 RepID=A0AAE0H0Q6_9CHLO|nr:hypothetical protein CYMTET_4676 [Cymbomonas tetramitiformis]
MSSIFSVRKNPPKDVEGSPAEGGAEVEMANEWDRVTAAVQEDQTTGAQSGPQRTAYPPVSYRELLTYINQIDIEPLRSQLLVEEPPSGLFAKLCFCFGPPKLTGVLADERERCFAMAKIQFDENEEMHHRLLQTIFRKYTGATGTVARYGSHWEDVGFQGKDPATDLRSCGVLGLVHLLYLHHHNEQSAAAIYMLSRDTIQEFPLAPLSINLTSIALKALRAGQLSAEAKRRGSTWSALADFYVGAFYQFYLTWKAGGKTMKDSGFVRQALEKDLLSTGTTAATYEVTKRTLGASAAVKAEKESKGEELLLSTEVLESK